MLFYTTDTTLAPRNGSEVTIIRELTPDEADIDDVGMMYKIMFPDGFITDAFDNELRR